MTHVGYGVQSVSPRVVVETVRYQGVSDLVGLGEKVSYGYLQTRANPGNQLSSGICFGDAGGPATDIVVAVHAFVNIFNCKGISNHYRVDIATSLDFSRRLWRDAVVLRHQLKAA